MAVRKRILLADDSAIVRKYLSRLFASHFSLEICAEAVNGREAVDKAKELHPDLIILDLSMPVMDGLQAARAICEIFPDVPIILFSMYADVLDPLDTISCIMRIVPKDQAHTLVGHAEDLLRTA